MRLVMLGLDSFGHFRQAEITFAKGLNLILGANEAGKSTVVDATLATLFGLGRRTVLEKALRARYQPLAPNEPFRATIVVELEDGAQFRVQRDLAEPRKSLFQYRSTPSAPWREAGTGEIDAVLRELRVADMGLFRSTLLITGSQVVIESEDEKAVTRAIGAKLASGEGDVTANQALKKLSERLYSLTHKERREALDRRSELEARRRELYQLEADLAQLEDEAEHAEEEAATARAYAGKYRPIVDGYRESERIAAEYAAKVETQQSLLAELERVRVALGELRQAGDELAEFAPDAAEVLNEANVARLAELEARLAELRRSLDETRRHKMEAEQQALNLEKRLDEARSVLAGANEALFTRERLGEIRAALVVAQEVENEVGGRTADLEKLPVAPANRLLGALGGALAALAAAIEAFLLVAPRATGTDAPGTFAWLGLPAFLPAGAALLAATAAVALLGAWLSRERRARRGRREREEGERQLAEAKRRLDQARLRFTQVSAGYSPQQFEMILADVEKARQTVADLKAALRSEQDKAGVLRPDRLEETQQALTEQRRRLLEAAGAADAVEFRERWQRYNNARARGRQGENAVKTLLDDRPVEDLEAALASLSAEVFTLKNALDTAKARVSMFTPADVFSWEERLAALNLPVLEERARGLREKLNDFKSRILRDDPLELDDALTATSERIDRQEFEAKALELAIATLRDAMEEVQGNLVPRIEKRAADLLSQLTGGRHGADLRLVAQPEGLEISFPRQVGSGVEPSPGGEPRSGGEPGSGGELLGRHHLSSATADQLYLALRVALAEALFDSESTPLIVDDPFLTYDAERFRAGCRLLMDMAEHRQVIWVTKDREAAIAAVSAAAGAEAADAGIDRVHVIDLSQAPKSPSVQLP